MRIDHNRKQASQIGIENTLDACPTARIMAAHATIHPCFLAC